MQYINSQLGSFFFANSIKQNHSSFKRLFGERDEEDENAASRIAGHWGILFYIFDVVEITRMDYRAVLGMNIIEVFNLVSFIRDKRTLEAEAVKQWKLSH